MQVSRGAECIMVEKQFFIDHAPQEVKHAVMSLVRPYPEVEVLQGKMVICPCSCNSNETLLTRLLNIYIYIIACS